MANYLVKVYDGNGKELHAQWFEGREIPSQAAGKLTRSIPNAVSHDILLNGEQSMFPQWEVKGSKGERNANAS